MNIDKLNDIKTSVTDILTLDFQVVKAQGDYVPGYQDSGLSFERGAAKRSKMMNTCVLYADIRNSTTLSHQHSHETMARLYTAFTKSILKIAEYHGAVVRNIIGDRVMLVFPEKDCFKRAIDTAVSINTTCKHIIDPLFKGLKFEVGIGIDYGEIMIVKAGIPKQEPERTNYKNLIWIGKPANIASKLTDVANKIVKTTIFKVTYHPPNLMRPVGLLGFGRPEIGKRNPFSYLPVVTELTTEQFAQKVSWNDQTGFSYADGRFVGFTKEVRTSNDPPILMTAAVFESYAKEYPETDRVKKAYFKPQTVKVNDYNGVIYGGDIIWTNHP